MTYKIGERVRYTGRDAGYNEPQHIGKLGTVTHGSTGHLTGVDWDDYKPGVLFSTPSNEVYTTNVSLATAFEMVRDPHLDEQITRAEWRVKPPKHGKDEMSIPIDDPRVIHVAKALEAHFADPNGILDDEVIAYDVIAQVAIASLREYLEDNRPKVTEWKLTLDSIDPYKKIQSIKAVRTYSGLGLKEAKDFVEGRLPRVVNQSLTEQELEQARYDFTSIGATITVSPV